MSFNNNHNHSLLNSTNYEPYFLLYVDNELNSEERQAVENFLALHPDLQSAMAALMAAKLPSEIIECPGKEVLCADSMKMSHMEESLLLYLDNELPEKDKKEVEDKIQVDAAYQAQHQLLSRTRLSEQEVILFPYKKILYRPAKKVFSFWGPVAAALIIMAGLSVWWFTVQQKHVPLTRFKKPVQREEVISKTILPMTPSITAMDTASVLQKNKTEINNKTIAAVAKRKKEDLKGKVELMELPKNMTVAEETGRTIDKAILPVIVAERNSKAQEPMEPPVIIMRSENEEKKQELPSHQPEAPVIVKAANKQQKIKSILRKATHFVERTTGVNPVNDNNELLIGAVSIKL